MIGWRIAGLRIHARHTATISSSRPDERFGADNLRQPYWLCRLHQVGNDLALDFGQPLLTAQVEVRQQILVETQLM